MGPQQKRDPASMPKNAAPSPWYRMGGENPSHLDDPQYRHNKLARVEAALFLSDEPILARKLARVAGLHDTAEAHSLVEKLKQLYDSGGSAFTVVEIAGGYQLLTRKEYHGWIVRAKRSVPDEKISAAAMETLAVIVDKQPVTRADIESVRGVQCGELLTQLMERGLIKIVGREESLGRPVLYGTTRRFLQIFGLNDLKELENQPKE
jgi:segregation and condensation protein B